MKPGELVFLKLGGSLITDKTKPRTPQHKVIQRISAEIAHALEAHPTLNLVIGHGSGSFGHVSASKHQTHNGGRGEEYWYGFAEVWRSARQLNQIMIENLTAVGLNVIAFPPSSGVIAEDQQLQSWDLQPLKLALTHRLIPIVQGDVIFDVKIGGTIFSTEQIFDHLTQSLHPDRVLLAGQDWGVYHNPDSPEDVIPHISCENIQKIMPVLSGAETIDVTGGMYSKVQWIASMIKATPSLQVQIFSGAVPGNIQKALTGENFGTSITS